MALSGDLGKFPLADVLQSINQNGMSGALAVRDRLGERLIQFEDGWVTGCVGIESDSKELGAELIRQRKVSTSDISRPSRFFKRKGSLKRALKRRRILDSGEFNSFARQVVLERIYDCFLLEEGTYDFKEEYDKSRFNDDEESAGVKISASEILMEAMRRVDEWKRIKRSIPSFKEVYVATRASSEDDRELDTEILGLTAAGNMDLDTVLENVPVARFTACEAVLAMVESGALRVATAPEYLDLGKAAQDREDFESAANFYGRGLHYERGNTDLQKRRIAVLELLGRNQDAAAGRKVYAGLLLEQGEIKAAQEQYTKASELAPSDPLPLERLLDLQVDRDKDYLGGRETAKTLVELYLRLGLGDSAKGVFPRLLLLKPKDRWLRERMAETHVELHENATAGQIYKELATEVLDEGDPQEAAKLLRRTVELTPEDEKAKTLLEDIESGTHAKKRRRRRILIALGVLSFVGGLAALWGGYEVKALVYLRRAQREAEAQRDRGCLGLLAGVERVESARQGHPLTQASYWAGETIVGLARQYTHEARRANLRFELGPPPKKDPQPKEQVLETLEKAINEGPTPLPELIAQATALLDADKRAEAILVLAEAEKRIARARGSLNRATHETRRDPAVRVFLHQLRGLMPTLYLDMGRVHFVHPPAAALIKAGALEGVSSAEPGGGGPKKTVKEFRAKFGQKTPGSKKP